MQFSCLFFLKLVLLLLLLQLSILNWLIANQILTLLCVNWASLLSPCWLLPSLAFIYFVFFTCFHRSLVMFFFTNFVLIFFMFFSSHFHGIFQFQMLILKRKPNQPLSSNDVCCHYGLCKIIWLY